MLGDDIVQADKPAIKQLMEQYEKTGKSIVGVQTVPESQTHRYGIVNPDSQENNLYKVKQFVEKPEQGKAPSNLAIMGRYVLSPSIFEYLESQERGAGGEIQLTDAIERMNNEESVYAYDFDGQRYDVGEKIGFIKRQLILH